MRASRLIRAAICLGGIAATANLAATTEGLAPGYGALEYAAPPPGSYRLPPLGRAPDGMVLDTEGKPVKLHELFDGRICLLSFMYSQCSDVNGCPLSSHVFYKIKSAMREMPEIARHLKLISMSFDPEHDTAEAMKLYSENFRYAGNAGEWVFVTAESQATLKPILSAYRQDVKRILTGPGGDIEFSHLLRVFLIDQKKRIRNIYSATFLHADLLLNDVRTLLAESDQSPHGSGSAPEKAHPAREAAFRPGDDKTGYASGDYRTNSLALANRRGTPADLTELIEHPPLGLPAVPQLAANPATRDKIALGRKLFYDRRLSINDTFSCAMCHVPEQGFTSNEMATAIGVEGRTVRRNSPTIYNIAYASRLFHDGREENLEQQIWAPLLAKNEMANPSVGFILQKIRSLQDYDGLFEKAFDGKPVGMESLGMAVASYERTLLSANSAFDRWYYGADDHSLSTAGKRGFDLFTGKAACATCHTIGRDAALFTDNAMHNTGLGYANSIGVSVQSHRVTLAPGVFFDVDRSIIDSVAESPPADIGLYEITELPADRWKYKTPSLRNVALTAPYMHNGQFSTLEEVVKFYDRGGVANPLLDPALRPLGLRDDEIEDLVAFLKALTGDNVDVLVKDAFAAVNGDVDGNPVGH